MSIIQHPHRAYSLLPKAKLVAILHDPIKRAYSWYEHMKAHKDPTATGHTFSEVIRASPQLSSDKKLLSLRDHCLSPGRYHIHLSKWLKHYPHKQLYLVDGGALVDDPASVLAKLQTFLAVERRLNYSRILRFVHIMQMQVQYGHVHLYCQFRFTLNIACSVAECAE